VRLVSGAADGPVAVLLPGTASTGDFIGRAFGPALAALGIGVVSADPPLDGGVADRLAALDEAVTRFRPVLVGGVSIGAHLAVRWAAAHTGGHRPDGLLLAMPAWTGPPADVAAASGAAAVEVERDGVPATLRRIRASAAGWPDAGWVVDELAAAWPAYTAEELAGTLRTTASSAGPSAGELASVDLPCGVAALGDDPLHPAAVAREWAAALPAAALVETRHAVVGADRASLGRAALLGWLRARATR
jgi:hypothetical protein